jgi:hypothetical protein
MPSGLGMDQTTSYPMSISVKISMLMYKFNTSKSFLPCIDLSNNLPIPDRFVFLITKEVVLLNAL